VADHLKHVSPHTVSEVDFSRKSKIFPPPHAFITPADGFSLELDIGTRDQKSLWLFYINSVRGASRLWGETSMWRNVRGEKSP